MTTDALDRLRSLVRPPAHPTFTSGDRAAARAAAGWDIPAHVFEVIEAYGESSWLDWLLLPSPFSEASLEDLANHAPDIAALSGGRPSLVAYSDPEGTSLFIGDDGLVSVAVDGAATATRLPLAGVLHSWLSGGAHFGLGPPGLPDAIAAYATPLLDASRASRITWLVLRPTGGTRASRWDALRIALGTLVPLSVNGEGERRQDKVFVEDAELWLTYDTITERSGLEQLNLQHYLDRLDDVKRLLTPALAAAGFELVRAEGPRGVVPW